MMDKVLHDHPTAPRRITWKPIAGQNRALGRGAQRTGTAQRLEPGLSFAAPQAVRELQAA